MFELIKHLAVEAKKFLWEDFRKRKAEKLAADRFKFDTKLLNALIQNADENVMVTVKDKDGVQYIFTKIDPNSKPRTQPQQFF